MCKSETFTAAFCVPVSDAATSNLFKKLFASLPAGTVAFLIAEPILFTIIAPAVVLLLLSRKDAITFDGLTSSAEFVLFGLL